MASHRLLVHGIKQLVQVVNNGAGIRCGDSMKQVDILQAQDGQGFSLLVDSGGFICDIGTDGEVTTRHPQLEVDKKLDATGQCLLPGLIDGHTHPVWAGDRVHEFALKLAGATYMEVHKAGGGIHFTVDKTRNASEDELFSGLKARLETMQRSGTTLVECKSGYGLNTDTEIKMLKVIERARKEVAIDISSTFCGAHAVPKGKTAEEATDDVIHDMLPRLQKLRVDGTLHVDNIDVFCEQGVFTVEQSRKILLAGKELNLQLNFHGDELHPTGSAEMGSEIGALAISHLEEISDKGIKAMSKAKSVGVILPTTAYILRLSPPPVRRMIDDGMAVALGSDFNPNAHCLSMPLVMHLACVTLRMSMAEALNAATINAAASLGLAKTHGSLEIGKLANMILLNNERWEHLIYQLGCQRETIRYVIHHGNVIHENN